MKFTRLIIAFILIFILGCEKKDKDMQEQTDINVTQYHQSDEAVLTENTDRPFSLTLNSGEILNMQKIENGFKIDGNKHATLFVFFTTWCPPCKIQMPILNNIQAKYADKLQIIGVVLEDMKDEKLKKFIVEQKISYKISSGSQNDFFIKAMGGVDGLPFMVLYYPNGEYAVSYIGLIPEEILENDLLRFL